MITLRWTSGISYTNVFTDYVQNKEHLKLCNRKTTNPDECGGHGLSVNCPLQVHAFGHIDSKRRSKFGRLHTFRKCSLAGSGRLPRIRPLWMSFLYFQANFVSWIMPCEELLLQVPSSKGQAAFCCLQHDGCFPKTVSHKNPPSCKLPLCQINDHRHKSSN